MRTKNTITKEFAKRYQKARKKEKTKILNELSTSQPITYPMQVNHMSEE